MKKKNVKKVLPLKKPNPKKKETQNSKPSKIAKIVKPVEKKIKPLVEKDKKEVNLQKLVAKGKKQGFLTQEDILQFFPEAEENITELDSLYSKLLELGIDVFDNTVAEEVPADDGSEFIDLDVSADKAVSSDPVRMYLREIGKV